MMHNNQDPHGALRVVRETSSKRGMDLVRGQRREKGILFMVVGMLYRRDDAWAKAWMMGTDLSHDRVSLVGWGSFQAKVWIYKKKNKSQLLISHPQDVFSIFLLSHSLFQSCHFLSCSVPDFLSKSSESSTLLSIKNTYKTLRSSLHGSVVNKPD